MIFSFATLHLESELRCWLHPLRLLHIRIHIIPPVKRLRILHHVTHWLVDRLIHFNRLHLLGVQVLQLLLPLQLSVDVNQLDPQRTNHLHLRQKNLVQLLHVAGDVRVRQIHYLQQGHVLLDDLDNRVDM